MRSNRRDGGRLPANPVAFAAPLIAVVWLMSGAALAQSALSDDPRLERCVAGLLAGYGSGLEETACRAQYDLPSAYLFTCARKLRQGFADRHDRAACVAFLEGETAKTRNGYLREGAN